MNMKKHSLHLYVAVVLLISFIGMMPLMTSVVFAEEMTTEKTKDTKLAVPQNVRVEDGFIVWDEVEDAYGYTLKTTVNGKEILQTCYETRVEINRFFYEKQQNMSSSKTIDFGSYDFAVCAFDETHLNTEYSAPVTVSYEASFAAPTNVTFIEDEEKIQFDEVSGAFRFNIRIFNDDADRTFRSQTYYHNTTSISMRSIIGQSGNYWISIQAMDKDYHVSEWTEPIAASYTASERLEAPKNLRFDESGEKLLWDAVEGADYYTVGVSNGGSSSYETAECDNWKTLFRPYGDYDTNTRVYVYAYNYNGAACSDSSTITSSWKPQRDDTIPVPENLRFEDGRFQWDTIDCSCWWPRLLAYETSFYDMSSYRHTDNWGYHIGSRFPAGDYELELFFVNENGNYNSKKYPVTLNTIPDETVWIPKMYYKFETLLWDYDRVRHDKTDFFWIRIKKENGDVIKLVQSWSEQFYGLKDLSNGDYIIDTCVYEYNDKLGNWSEPLLIEVFDGQYFDKKNESTTDVELPPEAEDIPVEDRITSITINPAFNMKNKNDNNVELDLSKIKIKAKEIYNEEGLKRASEALGETISGNKHYNLMDLTLLYKEEDFSNGYEGLVQVIIPLPKGHRDKTFSCYRLTEVNGKMTKEVIPGEQTDDSYIIYLEHFSEYALVADGGEEAHTHTFSDEWNSDENSHWKECLCGVKSEEAVHSFGEWKITKEATINEEGTKERSCTICSFKQRENISKLTNSNDSTNSDITNTVNGNIDDDADSDTKPEPVKGVAPNTNDYTPFKLYMTLTIIAGFICLSSCLAEFRKNNK